MAIKRRKRQSELEKEEVKLVNKDIPQWKAVANLIVRKEPFIKTTTQKIKRSANI